MTTQCQWCLEETTKPTTVANATMDLSHLDICPECLPEVLQEIPDAEIVHKPGELVTCTRSSKE